MALKPFETASEVCILLRVYNIEGENPDMLAYLDPYKAKVNGVLECQVKSWSVRPR